MFTGSRLLARRALHTPRARVAAACFLAVGLWFRDKSWYRPAITVPASVVIALIGVYWSVTRIGLVPEFLPYV